MRVCLVSQGDLIRNPNARALSYTLKQAGHDVAAVTVAPGAGDMPAGVKVIAVPGRLPQRWGVLGAVLRRMQPKPLRRVLLRRALRRAVRRCRPEIVYPVTAHDVGLAAASVGAATAVFVKPEWPDPGPRNVARLAPADGRWSSSPSGVPGPGVDYRRSAEGLPAPNRHQGTRLVLVYRRTATSPGRYLEAALRRAGVDVLPWHDGIEWSAVPAAAAAVVIVESPYPAWDVAGVKPGVPVLYWVHHGEHHLDANLRLARRYGADAVLLAHSWHLGHRFGVPVHRFPFAVAPEIITARRPFGDRRYDVAMVGAGVTGAVSRYRRRNRMLDELGAAYPDTIAFRHGVAPEEMAEIYGDARIVLNEVGTRHHPITMRVFEAVGSGALLLTDPVPGMEMLFAPDHYRVLEEGVVAQVAALLRDQRAADSAAAASAHAANRHTYDHRVDELLEIAAAATPGAAAAREAVDGMAAVIDRDVEVQQIAAFGLPALAAQLPSRAVWDGAAIMQRLQPQRMEGVAVGPSGAEDLERVVLSAKRYVYADADIGPAVSRIIAAQRPDAVTEIRGGILRVDLMLDEGYRLLPGSFQLTI